MPLSDPPRLKSKLINSKKHLKTKKLLVHHNVSQRQSPKENGVTSAPRPPNEGLGPSGLAGVTEGHHHLPSCAKSHHSCERIWIDLAQEHQPHAALQLSIIPARNRAEKAPLYPFGTAELGDQVAKMFGLRGSTPSTPPFQPHLWPPLRSRGRFCGKRLTSRTMCGSKTLAPRVLKWVMETIEAALGGVLPEE